MRAEIICVGSELLLGDIADTNTQYLARRLSRLGIDLYYSTAVGDNQARLLDCLERAFQRSDLVLTSGGLGPTEDDLTREAIAALVGESPAVDKALEMELRRFFRARRLEMTVNNLKQAWLIPSATAISNRRGTAPGWWVRKHGRQIVAMPGPPGELHAMWEHEVEPKLCTGAAVIRSRTIKLFNISESLVDEALKPLTRSSNPTVAIYAKQDGIQVRITAKAGDPEAALRAIAPIEEQVRGLLGDSVWGADEDTHESVAGALLSALGTTLAVGEAVTSGKVAALVGSAPANEKWFRGALVIGGEDQHHRDAMGLAAHAKEQFGADIGLSICGWPVEGADPAVDELLIGVYSPKHAVEHTGSYRCRHESVKTLGAYYALHELRITLRALANDGA